jgi:membrane protease YdiL (CAAX protease family)
MFRTIITGNDKVLTNPDRPSIRSVVLATVLVVGIYMLLPLVGAALGISSAAILAITQRGPAFYWSESFQRYLGNLEAFAGELTLLLASGILAAWILSRNPRNSWPIVRLPWTDLAIGIAVGLIGYFCIDQILLPWLYAAMPTGTHWPTAKYNSIDHYARSGLDRSSRDFFVSTVYCPTVETIIFVPFLYTRLRSQFGLITSMLVAALIFACVHQNKPLFLSFYLFALINFGLYELRKSIVAPLLHHIFYNGLIYGSQMLSFTVS